MSNWKFTDIREERVFRINEDGSCESCLVECIAEWIKEGNTPDPADLAPNPRIAEIKAELDALDFKKIRPIASGDTEYLAILQAKTATLRDELAAL